MEWKFWDREHNMFNFGLLCSPSLRETNMFTAVELKLKSSDIMSSALELETQMHPPYPKSGGVTLTWFM